MQHGSKVRYKVKLRVSLKHLKIYNVVRFRDVSWWGEQVGSVKVFENNKVPTDTSSHKIILKNIGQRHHFLWWSALATLASDVASSNGLHWQHQPVMPLPLTVCIGNIGQWRCFLWLSALATLASSHVEEMEPTLDAWGLPKKQVCLTADSGSNCATTVYTTQNLSDILLKR